MAPQAQRTGAGRLLLAHAEAQALAQGARLLVVETSDATPLARARQFYIAQGYVQCGRVPHFYGNHEAKLIYTRHLAALQLT